MPASTSALLKRVVPAGGKEAAGAALRAWGRATAALRPLPDFLIVGTKRGGTTSLWNYLLQHPGVLPMFPSAANRKSPHYFYWHYDRGPGWYRSHFATGATRLAASRRTGGPVVTGEASPNYLYDPRVPSRVAELMPAATIVVLLRDPVERAYSHYKERTREGVEKLSFEEALAAEPGRLAGEVERMEDDPYYYSRPRDWYAYRDRGLYLPQLQGWLKYFPSALVLRSEDLYADPAAITRQVTDRLGLEPAPLREATRFNYRPAKGMPAAARAELSAFYAPHNRALADYLGRDLGWTE